MAKATLLSPPGMAPIVRGRRRSHSTLRHLQSLGQRLPCGCAYCCLLSPPSSTLNPKFIPGPRKHNLIPQLGARIFYFTNLLTLISIVNIGARFFCKVLYFSFPRHTEHTADPRALHLLGSWPHISISVLATTQAFRFKTNLCRQQKIIMTVYLIWRCQTF